MIVSSPASLCTFATLLQWESTHEPSLLRNVNSDMSLTGKQKSTVSAKHHATALGWPADTVVLRCTRKRCRLLRIRRTVTIRRTATSVTVIQGWIYGDNFLKCDFFSSHAWLYGVPKVLFLVLYFSSCIAYHPSYYPIFISLPYLNHHLYAQDTQQYLLIHTTHCP